MKILFVATHVNIGGITNYMFLLGRALMKRGATPIVVTSGGALEKEFAREGIEVVKVDFATKFELSPKVFRGAKALAAIARSRKAALIHAHTRVTQVASALASRRCGVPYVTTCHGFFTRRLGRALFGCWGERVVAISAPVRESLIRDFKVKPGRVALIHNGIDLTKFSKVYTSSQRWNLKKRHGLTEAPVAGTIGRLSPVKGHRTFIEAMAELVRRGIAVQGTIVGDGPDEAALKARAASAGLGATLHFFPSTPETPDHLAMMDVFVFPSVKEGLGLSLLEAMAAGKACVASAIGGIPDLIRDGETGILVPAGDGRALADAVERLLRDEELRLRLGDAARSFVRAHFSVDEMAEKMVALYRTVIDGHAKR